MTFLETTRGLLKRSRSISIIAAPLLALAAMTPLPLKADLVFTTAPCYVGAVNGTLQNPSSCTYTAIDNDKGISMTGKMNIEFESPYAYLPGEFMQVSMGGQGLASGSLTGLNRTISLSWTFGMNDNYANAIYWGLEFYVYSATPGGGGCDITEDGIFDGSGSSVGFTSVPCQVYDASRWQLEFVSEVYTVGYSGELLGTNVPVGSIDIPGNPALAAVPEPGTFVGGLGALLAGIISWRRRKLELRKP
jgi:hypothetical protein